MFQNTNWNNGEHFYEYELPNLTKKHEFIFQVRHWVDSISQEWRFKRIIPAHFAGPINASRSDFLAAFAFLDELLGERYVTRLSLSLVFSSIMGKAASYFPPDDMRTLSSLDQFLVSVGAVKKTVSGKKRWKQKITALQMCKFLVQQGRFWKDFDVSHMNREICEVRERMVAVWFIDFKCNKTFKFFPFYSLIKRVNYTNLLWILVILHLV